MARLNQIVAVVAGKKTRTEKEFGDLNKTVQKPDLFSGLSRQYQPLEENGDDLPPELKLPQQSVAAIIASATALLTSIVDAVATQEYGNCGTAADVTVDGNVVVAKAPVTVLLYLEKQLNDLHTFVGNLPVLDASERWSMNAQTGQWEAEPTKTVRTKKVAKPIVMYPATVEHPAQTQLVSEDISAGWWTTRKYSTAMAATARRSVLDRIDKLREAVKVAREEANSVEVADQKIAASVLSYVFGN